MSKPTLLRRWFALAAISVLVLSRAALTPSHSEARSTATPKWVRTAKQRLAKLDVSNGRADIPGAARGDLLSLERHLDAPVLVLATTVEGAIEVTRDQAREALGKDRALSRLTALPDPVDEARARTASMTMSPPFHMAFMVHGRQAADNPESWQWVLTRNS
jgi:hypothetical protein